MSMASYEPDRDWGDENFWQEAVDRVTSGLCVYCRDEQAMAGDDLCADCLAEIVGEVVLEEADPT